jgi:hypothetical protein
VTYLTVRPGDGAHDGLKFFKPRRAALNPETQLKLCAVMFTVLWTGWMLWSSGSLDRVNVILMTICGAAAGYAWYRAMRWQFRRSGLHSQDERSAGPGAKR